MTEPLSVDTSRLDAAARVLGDLDVPAPPQRLTITGTDAMSAAISQVLPVIEAPVIDGLPIADSALTKTAADMATAAAMYDETDKASAGDIVRPQFDSGGAMARTQTSSAAAKAAATDTGAEAVKPATRDTAPGISASEQLSGQLASLVDKLPSAEQAAQQLGQMAPMMGSVTQSMSQQVQGLISKAQGAARNPSTPSVPPAPDTTVDDPKDQEEEKSEDDQPPAEGAEAGRPDGSRVPIGDAAPLAAPTEVTPTEVTPTDTGAPRSSV